MKNAIKLGDLYFVPEEPEKDPKHSLWYQFGFALAAFCWQVQMWLKPHSFRQLAPIMIHPIDYSRYETPTVYRKWR